MTKFDFDPAKFSMGGITKPILFLFSLLFTSGSSLFFKSQVLGLIILSIAIIMLIIWVVVFFYLLRKDPNKLRSEKHEQRIRELER